MMAADGDDSRGADAADDRARRHAAFDPDWYRARYPDVAAASADPVEHFRTHGRAEGRFPNAASELLELGENLDAAWYSARYPDVAAAGVDPASHYLLYGRAEGRYPDADREPREVWDSRFDRVWYRARNADLGPYPDDPLEHFRRIGLLEGRAANAAEEDRAAWRGVFDPDWYRARNPDVARRGLDPLEHFITEGLIDRRRPNAGVVLPCEPVTAARIERVKGDAFADEVALFVTHAADGAVKPHVAHHLACLRRSGIECVLIAACDRMDVAVTGAAREIADHVFQRANAGFDFAAWAHVLRLHPTLMKAQTLYLLNDSVFGPTSPEALARVVGRVRASEADFVGLTDNADRGWHVQSYFLALKRRFLASEAGRRFFDGIVSYSHKNDVVNEYETQLARRALGAGFRIEVLFPAPDWLDATLHNWRRLLRAGFPYLKVGTARGLVPGVETADWRTEMAARGYDTRAADATLARMALEPSGGLPSSRGLAAEAAGACRAEMHAFLAEGGAVAFPEVADPALSFLAVLDGRPERLLRFLRALAEGDRARMEVVIVDNASTDDTHDVLGRLSGATVVTNIAPLPRARAVRQAVARARAGVVVLLSPDGWEAGHPGAPSPGPAVGSGAHAPDVDRAVAQALAALSAAGSGPTYAACDGPDGAPGQTFAVIHRGRRIGTAHAMLRREASPAPEQPAGPHDAGSADPQVL